MSLVPVHMPGNFRCLCSMCQPNLQSTQAISICNDCFLDYAAERCPRCSNCLEPNNKRCWCKACQEKRKNSVPHNPYSSDCPCLRCFLDEQKMAAIPDEALDAGSDEVLVHDDFDDDEPGTGVGGSNFTPFPGSIFTPPRTKRIATVANPGAAFVTPNKQAKKNNDLAVWKSTARPQGPHAHGHLGPSSVLSLRGFATLRFCVS